MKIKTQKNYSRGASRWNWKGGRTVASTGYILVLVGKGHHLADVRGYAYEHRLVAEKKLGRKLKPSEQVHHVNENKQDNREDNIEIYMGYREHAVNHRKEGSKLRMPNERNPKIYCACCCGTMFKKFDDSGRPRKFVKGHKI